MPDLQIRAMRRTDLSAVFALQCLAYPAGYHEPETALLSRLTAGAEFCFVAELAGQLVGYVFAHPWAGDPPVLHRPLTPMAVADHVFIHDLAVSPACRRAAAGKRLQAAVLDVAVSRGFADMRANSSTNCDRGRRLIEQYLMRCFVAQGLSRAVV